MDSNFWIDLFVPRELTNKRKFTIYTLQCIHYNDNCNYNLTYVQRQRYLTFVRHFYCGTEPIHLVFDTRLPADFVECIVLLDSGNPEKVDGALSLIFMHTCFGCPSNHQMRDLPSLYVSQLINGNCDQSCFKCVSHKICDKITSFN